MQIEWSVSNHKKRTDRQPNRERLSLGSPKDILVAAHLRIVYHQFMDQKKESPLPRSLFATQGTFSELYPFVSELLIHADEYAYNPKPVASYRFDLTRPPGESIPCTNPRCNNGKFRLGRLIYDAVTERATVTEKTVGCDSKPRSNQQQCLHSMELKIEMRFKDSESESNE